MYILIINYEHCCVVRNDRDQLFSTRSPVLELVVEPSVARNSEEEDGLRYLVWEIKTLRDFRKVICITSVLIRSHVAREW